MTFVQAWGVPGVGPLALRHDGFLQDAPPWSLDMRAMMLAVRIQGRMEGAEGDGYGGWEYDNEHVGDINGAQFWDKSTRAINMMRFATGVVVGTGAMASGRRGHGGAFDPVPDFPQFIDPVTGLPFGGPGASGFPTFTDQETGQQFGQNNGSFPSFIDPVTGQPFTGPQGGFPGFTPQPDPPSFPPGMGPPPAAGGAGGGGGAAGGGAPPPQPGAPPAPPPPPGPSGGPSDPGPVPGFPQGFQPYNGNPLPGTDGGGGGWTSNIFMDDAGTDTTPAGG